MNLVFGIWGILGLPADQIKSEKHGQGEDNIHWDPLGSYFPAMVGQLGGPQEVVFTWYRVDGTDHQFHANLSDSLPSHGDTPIIGTIVYHKKLKWKL